MNLIRLIWFQVAAARYESLLKHVMNCDMTQDDARTTWIMNARKDSTATSLKRRKADDSDALSSVSNGASVFTTPTASVQRAGAAHIQSYFKTIAPDDQIEANELLAVAFITGGIPFSFTDNPYFKECIKKLTSKVSRGYRLPDRKVLVQQIIPVISRDLEVQMYEQLKRETNFTLSLDGWSDISQTSVYALMLMRNDGKRYYIGDLKLHGQRHTSANILRETLDLLMVHNLMPKVKAVVTDSRTTMVRFRNDLCAQYPSVLPLRCSLHAFNLIAKDILKSHHSRDTVKRNLALVNYFTANGFWNDTLGVWAAQNGVNRKLSTFCETRWYSMMRVCMSVQEFEDGFFHCKTLEENAAVETPTIPADKKAAINRDHFNDNQHLMNILRPVIDSIGMLEPAAAHIGQVHEALISAYAKIRDLALPPQFRPLQAHALDVLTKRAQEFLDDIYLIGFFLSPQFRKVAISQRTSLRDMQIKIILQARKWNPSMSKKQAQTLRDQVVSYYNNVGYFSRTDHDPKAYWSCLTDCLDTNLLKTFSQLVFSLTIHAAGVEQLFSMMGHIKSKSCNRMHHCTLSSLTRSKLLLTNQTLSKGRVKLSSGDMDQFAEMNTFDQLLEIEPELDAYDSDNELELAPTREDALWEQFFDLDAYQQVSGIDQPVAGGPHAGPIVAAEEEEWDIDSIMP